MYKLKANVADFTVVDGKFAGRTYRSGDMYEEIPPEEKEKFDKIKIASGKIEKVESVFIDSEPQKIVPAAENGGKKK